MYTKKIYFSGKDIHALQKEYKILRGVLEVLVGNISAKNVRNLTSPELRNLDNIEGICIEFNPKKTDVLTLMDVLFNLKNPYKENLLGIYYSELEDEPQIELYLNSLAKRGKYPCLLNSHLIINDFRVQAPRKYFVMYGQLENFTIDRES